MFDNLSAQLLSVVHTLTMAVPFLCNSLVKNKQNLLGMLPCFCIMVFIYVMTTKRSMVCILQALVMLLMHCVTPLGLLQAWSTSASNCLPSSASVYANTLGMRGSKPPLRQLDGLHWTLASGLALVSAALGLYIARSHNLKKQINNSNTELSRLLLKVGADKAVHKSVFHAVRKQMESKLLHQHLLCLHSIRQYLVWLQGVKAF